MSSESHPPSLSNPDVLYPQIVAQYGPALARLAGTYELNFERRQDLLQEFYFALWRSLARFDRRCSLRTWVFSLEEIEAMPDPADNERRMDETAVLERLGRLIQKLKIIDRDIILLYLEGVEAVEIGDIVGLSAVNIATKIHRIKALLMRRFHAGE